MLSNFYEGFLILHLHFQQFPEKIFHNILSKQHVFSNLFLLPRKDRISY